MELYNPTTDVMNFAAMEKDIMIAADVEVPDLDTTELKRKMTCKSVAKGWKKWVKAVKKHPKYRKATKAQRAKFWKKAALWAVKFDKKHGCGWVKAWKAYCKKSMKKLVKFVKAVKKHPKYLKATKKARMSYWKRSPRRFSSGTRRSNATSSTRAGRRSERLASSSEVRNELHDYLKG